MANTELDLRERRAIEDMLNAKVPVPSQRHHPKPPETRQTQADGARRRLRVMTSTGHPKKPME